ncbi:MAG: exopolysaccharide biosynthesis polyprenyl glycosylphosphotransferase [Lachnospiraceae bacterium]|nr:exopolysaccharide biosynthesis polyprenyl glycosylphosphotransferase [Lachnospiraceae bacterium]
MNRWKDSIKKIIALELPLLGAILYTLLYAWLWFKVYYPNYVLLKLKFYINGHILVMGIYVVLLLFFMTTYGGLKVGYLKPVDVILSQMFALLAVNVITYFEDSLMRNWMLPIWPMVRCTLQQILVSIVWVYFSDAVYKKAFPPSKLILIHGERPIGDILHKFSTRPDKYKVIETIDIADGIDAIKGRILEQKKPVVLWDINVSDRNKLMKFCYENSIRIYLMPKIPDVLIAGSAQLHLFDTPLFMTREYALTFNQRLIKRTIDVVCAALLLLITSPIFAVTALLVHFYDGGPVFYKQTRCTIGQKEFKIIKFRSMRVDAEKDGVARLASQNDDRITPIGAFIRKVRIDELPQLINILSGDMSFIGPRPERPEIIAQYVEEMPEFVFRMKVKAGLAGYAQIYGKYNTTPYDKLKLDLTYIQSYSVWLDLKLMLLTLKILLRPESTEGISEGQITALKNDVKQDE